MDTDAATVITGISALVNLALGTTAWSIFQSRMKVLREEKANVEAELKQKNEQCKELEKKIERMESKAGNRLFTRLNSEGFLSGFTRHPAQGTEILRRLKLLEVEKKNVAKQATVGLFRELRAEGKQSIFIESGSTLAHFARELTEQIGSLELDSRPDVLTNNFLAQLCLYETEGVNVGLTHGSLGQHYLAYLPFGPRQAESRGPASEEQRRAASESQRVDREAFRSLASSVAECSILYVTASNFGFLVGPLVGHLDNAMTKYCLYNMKGRFGRRPKIRVCIGGPHIFQNHTYKWDSGDPEFDVRTHMAGRCVPVFRIPEVECSGALRYALDGNGFGLKNNSSPQALGLTSKYGKAWDPDNPAVEVGPDTWLSFLQCGAVEFELLIGLDPRDPEVREAVVNAMKEANEQLETLTVNGAKIPGRYALEDSDNSMLRIEFVDEVRRSIAPQPNPQLRHRAQA